jgi:hypothetical protein
MRTKAFISSCFVVILFNCCNQKKELQSILSAGCYWDILDKGSIHPINSCYKFGEAGTCNFYYYTFFDKKRTDAVFLYDDGDIIIANKWSLAKDSIFIRSNRYHIMRYSSDSVFLTSKQTDTTVLIKNCKTYNPKPK